MSSILGCPQKESDSTFGLAPKSKITAYILITILEALLGKVILQVVYNLSVQPVLSVDSEGHGPTNQDPKAP